MKRKVILIAAAGALCGLLAVGGTLAWFTDSGEVVNKITVGNMNLTLTEPEWDEDDAKNVVPGAELDKDPTVTNVSDVAAFVKIAVTPGFKAPKENLDTGVIKYHVAGENEYKTLGGLKDYWNTTAHHTTSLNGYEPSAEIVNGVLYIYTALSKDETIEIFDKIQFDGDSMDNEYMNSELDITIEFDAVQIDNRGNGAEDESNKNIKMAFTSFSSDAFESVPDSGSQDGTENTDNPTNPDGQQETP